MSLFDGWKKKKNSSKGERKKVFLKKVQIFKIKNRKGYAAICFNNLTEGKTESQALERLRSALRRMGCELD
jgi:hypothetical protein